MDVYEPSTTVVRPDGFRDSIHIPMRFFYPRFDDLWELVVSKGWLAMEPLEKRINEVFKWVVLNHAYQYDLGEDWRNAQETFYYKKGDCEDSTILFVTLCRLAAIPADRVFNAIGSFNGTGHSFGIARHDDNRLYLYETTLSSPPSSIKAYDGNGPYKIDCLSNWKYVGVLK
jgi:transglutaminase-like putative cysteine protease